MQCLRCVRPAALALPQRTSATAVLQSGFRTVLQQRALSILTPRRPQALPSISTTSSLPTPTTSAFPSTPLALGAGAPDVLPKSAITTHPALGSTQLRCGPRDTYFPTNLVRKRRHGFLSRARRRNGKAVNKSGMKILKRRRFKGRGIISH